MAITVYRENFKLSKRQALQRLLEIIVSAVVIWVAYGLSSLHAGECGLGLVVLQSVACQAVAIVAFHLYDFIGDFRVRDVSDPKMPPDVRRLQQLAAPPQKDFFIPLPVAGSFAAFIGAMLPFIEGGAQDIQWSNWISSAIALGIALLWIFLCRRRYGEIHPKEKRGAMDRASS